MSTLYVDDNNIKSCVHLHTMVHITHIYIVVTSNLHEICYVELWQSLIPLCMYMSLYINCVLNDVHLYTLINISH